MQRFDLFKECKNRRTALVKEILQQNPGVQKGVVILFANFETEARNLFKQESNFFYLTGIIEPAAVFCTYFDHSSMQEILYMPNYAEERQKWVNMLVGPGCDPASFEIDLIKNLGREISIHICKPIFTPDLYQNLISDISAWVESGANVFTPWEKSPSCESGQVLFEYLAKWVPCVGVGAKSCSTIVDKMRRTKCDYELGMMNNAIGVTMAAHEAACKIIAPERFEFQVQAAVEYVFTYTGAQKAFPSIVATGKNTTVLHYSDNYNQLQDGDLVVVDIGAEWGFYASDLTRTYPVSGKFTNRQRQIYDVVLATQTYIESIAKPGMYLKSFQYPEKSLLHLAIKFLDGLGLAKYFVHGIGHYLGLDAHDVGSYDIPLQENDVFTIEPGIYIPNESLGVRIEDDYLMTPHGAVCLSCELPKSAKDVEKMMLISQD